MYATAQLGTPMSRWNCRTAISIGASGAEGSYGQRVGEGIMALRRRSLHGFDGSARRPGLLGRPGKQVLDPVAIAARDENKRRSMLHDRPTPT